MTTAGSTWRDALALSVGTFTAIPVPAPRVVDRSAAGRAMGLAPVVGLIVAACWFAVGWAASAAGLPALAVGGLVVAADLLITRAFHHDGLADTVDALASGYDRERALDIMRRGDVGPAGAAALAVTLLLEAACVGALATGWRGALMAALAPVIGRCMVPVITATTRAARPQGLGALVAGVPRSGVVAPLALMIALASLPVRVPVTRGWPTLAIVAAVLVTLAIRRRAVRRFGGLTGDVLGAVVRLGCVSSLLVLACAPHIGG